MTAFRKHNVDNADSIKILGLGAVWVQEGFFSDELHSPLNAFEEMCEAATRSW
jgi:hypothetical protein